MDRKILSGSTGAGLTALIIYILGLLGLEIPAEVASIITGVIGAVFGYFTPRALNEPSDASVEE
jgi:putative flippase GtrA